MLKSHQLSKFERIAREVSSLIPRRNRHVSLIIVNKSLVAVGTNTPYKTHPLARKHSYLFDNMHSELDAWIKIRHIEYRKPILVNYHFGPQGNIKIAKPCAKCLPWVLPIFDEIYFSTPNGVKIL